MKTPPRLFPAELSLKIVELVCLPGLDSDEPKYETALKLFLASRHLYNTAISFLYRTPFSTG